MNGTMQDLEWLHLDLLRDTLWGHYLSLAYTDVLDINAVLPIRDSPGGIGGRFTGKMFPIFTLSHTRCSRSGTLQLLQWKGGIYSLPSWIWAGLMTCFGHRMRQKWRCVCSKLRPQEVLLALAFSQIPCEQAQASLLDKERPRDWEHTSPNQAYRRLAFSQLVLHKVTEPSLG